MSERWGMFSNHALVLVYVLTHPESTVREISQNVGTTERATLAILRALDEDSVIERHRQGRRNTYTVHFERLSRFRRAHVAPLSPTQFINGLIETLLALSPGSGRRRLSPRRPPAQDLTAPLGAWGFFTNHLRLLIAIANESSSTVRFNAAGVGITERAALAIMRQLEDEGLIAREREGRRNVYDIDFEALRRSSRWSSATWAMPRPIVEYCVRGLRELAGQR